MMKLLNYIAVVILIAVTVECNDKLQLAYKWNEIDFKYANSDERWKAIEANDFDPSSVIPFGLEVFETRMFLTFPRWRRGVPASLAYFDLNDKSTASPVLKPYPGWQAHNLNESEPEIVSPFRIKADRCDRLWVLDSRISGVLETATIYGPPQLLVYDLHNDNLLYRHEFPASHVKEASLFANMAVEDNDCENTFVYSADLANPGLVVFSWKAKDSWRVQHHYFHPDPMSGNFSISDIQFQWDDGLYGMALFKHKEDPFSTLFFHPLSSTTEFSTNTSILQNKTFATSGKIYRDFEIVGSRGLNGQAGASFVDPDTGVLFYGLMNMNAVGCWRTSDSSYSSTQLYSSPTEMVFPSDIKIDGQNRIWILSNRLQEFIYGDLFGATVNYRILTANVRDLIKNTACEVKRNPITKITSKIGDVIKSVNDNIHNRNSASSSMLASSFLSLISLTSIVFFKIFADV